jgi:hypothetical protein
MAVWRPLSLGDKDASSTGKQDLSELGAMGMGMVVYTCDSSYLGGVDGRIIV